MAADPQTQIPIRSMKAFIVRNLAVLMAASVCITLSWTGAAYGQGNIGGTGTLVPDGGIIYIDGPAGSAVGSLLVTRESEVRRGDRLILLDGYDLLQAKVRLAEQEFNALNQTAADRIQLQKLAVESAELALEQAKGELANYQSLSATVISQNELAQRRYAFAQSALAVRIETVVLQQLVKNIAVEKDRARLKTEQANARLLEGIVTAPRDGTILDVGKGVGETLGGGPAIILGDLRNMYVDGDIYEGDILKVEAGMRATITGESFDDSYSGTVERVGTIIDTNARLAKLLIRLDNAEPVRRLVGMRVRFSIHAQGMATQ